MNTKTVTKTFTSSLALILSMCAFVAETASAHEFRGRLGSSPIASAEFLVQCSTAGGYATDHYVFSLNGLTRNTNYTLKAHVHRKGHFMEATDPVNGDRKPGTGQSLAQGNGAYFITITKTPVGQKTATGPMVFNVSSHCEAANNAHTGTTEAVPINMLPSNEAGSPFVTGAIASGASAHRRFLVACAPANGHNTSRYGFRVRAESHNRLFGVTLMVKDENGNTASATDKVASDVVFSNDGSWQYLDGGDGLYSLDLSKFTDSNASLKGAMNFTVENQCESGDAGVFTTISRPIRQ